MQAKYPVIGEVRGRGAMQAIELVEPGTKTPNTAAMNAVVKYCQSKGVLILTAGTYSNVVRFLPPIVITDELLKDALSVLDEALASL
jgi:4-aminobutyrate aminotransferase/(S)-3-amino-2-methylpropionate transaminase